MLLFKEKINYKLAGSGEILKYHLKTSQIASQIDSRIGGFAPHIDALAYRHIKDVRHLTILLAVDNTDMTNGGLEVVKSSQEMDVPIIEEDYSIPSAWVESHDWTPVELEAGMPPRPFCWV